MTQVPIMDSLNFTPDDLNANRTGNLTERQRSYLRFVLYRETVLYSVFALMPVLVLVILLNNPDISPFILLALALLALAFVLYVVGLQRTTRADLTGRVSVISGQIDLRDVGRGLYRLGIGQQSFEINSKVFAALSDGKTYHIYYTPNLKTIVSAERSEEPSA